MLHNVVRMPALWRYKVIIVVVETTVVVETCCH